MMRNTPDLRVSDPLTPRWLLVALAVMALLVANVRGAEPSALPPLDIWFSQSCPPCRQLIEDGRVDPAWVAQLRTRYTLRWHDVAREPDAAERAGINTVPQFVCRHGRIRGYGGKQWLLAALAKLRPPADPPAVPAPQKTEMTFAPAPPAATPPPQCACGPVFAEQFQALLALGTAQSETLQAVQLQIRQLPQPAPCDQAPVLQAIARTERNLREVLLPLGESPAGGTHPPPPAAGNRGWLTDSLGGLLPILLGAAGVVGTGGVGGLAVWGLSRVLTRVISRKRQAPARAPPAGSTSATPVAVAVPGPCPRCSILEAQTADLQRQLALQRQDVQFAPYEVDTFETAYTWAKRQLGVKYPGSQGTIDNLDSLIQQFLSSSFKSKVKS